MRIRNTGAAAFLVAAVTVAAGGAGAVIGSGPALAAQPGVDAPIAGGIPSAVPAKTTPAVDNGYVDAIAQVGNQIVIGGTFTSIGGVARANMAAFDATTGALTSSFTATVDAPVNTVLPGPTPGTVYIGGAFTTVGGVRAGKLALISATTGALVTSFRAPPMDGAVNDLALRGSRLYVGGNFANVGGVRHAGLASLNASSGTLDPFVNLQVAGHHNTSGTGAVGAVGVKSMDVNADGSRLIAVGNFTTVSGSARNQIVMADLTGTSAVVRADWNTTLYSPLCSSGAFDSYMRGVAFAPSGTWFAVTTTGGPHTGTLCDTATRWETAASGAALSPTWIDETGGDTLFGITVTSSAVFVGGHQRWLNNPLGSDSARPGAVPRPGLAALDPVTGVPLAWNPGRNPRGQAVFAILATSAGVWIGSDTDWIGNFVYKRPKLAFFPYTNATVAQSPPATLPGSVYTAGRSAAPSGPNVLAVSSMTATSVTAPVTAAGGTVPWDTARGAFFAAGKVWFGGTDSMLHSVTLGSAGFGTAQNADPYHDPVWAGVGTGTGTTVYTGASPTLFAQFPTLVTGMTYAGGRLYYTVAGDSRLFYRAFSPDSGIVGEKLVIVPTSVSQINAGGMFVVGSTLYVAQRTTGQLLSMAFSPTAGVTGAATVVSGPTVGGIDWRNRALFFVPSSAAAAKVAAVTTARTTRIATAGTTARRSTFRSAQHHHAHRLLRRPGTSIARPAHHGALLLRLAPLGWLFHDV